MNRGVAPSTGSVQNGWHRLDKLGSALPIAAGVLAFWLCCGSCYEQRIRLICFSGSQPGCLPATGRPDMNLPCLFHHQWDGCTCHRCGQTRDAEHSWNGCLCARCGLKRNQEHDWEVIDCHRRCRRCGWRGDESHAFEGCVCRHCGAVRHAWKAGKCTLCGLICTHPEVSPQIEGEGFDEETAITFHGQLVNVCKQCGQPLGVTWKK
jgi:hypothetical protein